MRKFLIPALLVVAILPAPGRAALSAPAAAAVVAHVIDARIDPESGEIHATDRLTLPPGADTWD
ncbi:MAG: hypothetical protein WAM94_20900, partial [Chromatiaceae bacterium]